MKMTISHRRDIFLEIFITFSMIKASLSFHVHVALLAWFTVNLLIIYKNLTIYLIHKFFLSIFFYFYIFWVLHFLFFWVFHFFICDRVCIKGPFVGKYETEISAVKVNWSILVGFNWPRLP